MVGRILSSTVAVAAAMGVVAAFAPELRRFSAYQATHERLRQEIERTVAAGQELKEKRLRFSSDAEFVERTAREAGYVHRDETIFHFPAEEGTDGL